MRVGEVRSGMSDPVEGVVHDCSMRRHGVEVDMTAVAERKQEPVELQHCPDWPKAD